VRTARVSRFTGESLPDVMGYCRDHQVILLVARCSHSDYHAVRLALASGFLLTDTLICYAKQLRDEPAVTGGGRVVVRQHDAPDRKAIESIAGDAFADYCGHYHNDPRLDRGACTEVYVSWARRSCLSQEIADEVLIAELGGRIAGFITLKLEDEALGRIVLNAVHPEVQRKGVYSSLLSHALRWFYRQDVRHVVTATQVANISVQKVWCRQGFEPSGGLYTFHKWFDRVKE